MNLTVRTLKPKAQVEMTFKMKTLNKPIKKFSDPTIAERIWNLCCGIDASEVKQSGLPQSIGLEDRFKKISSKQEVEEKLEWLIRRLAKLVSEDGRQPQASFKHNFPIQKNKTLSG